MTNLFSIFDPYTGYLPLNWVSAFTATFLILPLFWASSSQAQNLLKAMWLYLNSEFYAILAPISNPGNSFIPVSLFSFIMLNNVLGLIPYIFTSTSHLVLTISLALPLWLGHIMMAWASTPNAMLAHLVPLGTPYALMPLMVLIELTSNIIRPITLSVRLAANMVAGHLLLTLLSSQAPHAPMSICALLLVALVSLAILESAVALIQAYVFSVLMALYLNEVNSLTLIPS